MKRSEILNVIKEEVEVVLTNHEMIEFFDIDPVRLLDEMMIAEAEEGEEGLDVGQLGKERETRSAAKKRYRELGKTGGSQDITPRESGILKQIAGVLTQVAKTDDLMKYRPLIRPLLKKLQQRTQDPAAASGGIGEARRLDEKDLSAEERRGLPNSDFALPGKGEGPKGKQAGSYPIDTKARARSALGRVEQHGTSKEKAKVRAAVKRKFPDIKQGKD